MRFAKDARPVSTEPASAFASLTVRSQNVIGVALLSIPVFAVFFFVNALANRMRGIPTRYLEWNFLGFLTGIVVALSFVILSLEAWPGLFPAIRGNIHEKQEAREAIEQLLMLPAALIYLYIGNKISKATMYRRPVQLNASLETKS